MTQVNLVETAAATGRQTTENAETPRRAQLIDAAITAIAEHGLSGVTLAKVAGHAGLTAAMVNFHFTNKEALLQATLQHLADEYQGTIDAAVAGHANDPAAALAALVEAALDTALSQPRKVALWYAFWGEVRAREGYQALCGARDAAESRRIEDLCAALIAAGDYGHLDAGAVAGGLGGLLEESWQCFLIEDGEATRRERLRLCRAYLSGLFPKVFAQWVKAPASAVAPAPANGADSEIDGTWDRRMLPPWTYNSAEFTALEKDKLFRRHWLLVGHESEAPDPGCYTTLDAVDERILVVRGKDRVLRAFHNVCRHRASRVVPAVSGRCKRAITCPFHGWTYDFSGRLKGIPSAKTFPDLDAAKFGLKAVDLEIWQGFIFVRLGGDGPAVSDLMARADAELTPYRLDELQPYGQAWQYELPADWKVVHDVDNEGYHVPVAHPGLNQLLGQSYNDEAWDGLVARSSGLLREARAPRWAEGLYQSLLPEVDHLPESHRRAWVYYGLFPNLSIAFYPDLVDFFQAFPISPDRCLVRGRSYALPDERREMRAARWLNGRINRKVGEEDLDLVKWSSAGMQSSGFERVVLSDMERGLRDMHDVIRREIPVACQEQAPSPGTVAEVNRHLGG